MNEVIFWGTRGSLPVALTYRDIREKIIGALIAANGKTFKNRRHPAFRHQRHLWRQLGVRRNRRRRPRAFHLRHG
jgi:hypothetical protein